MKKILDKLRYTYCGEIFFSGASRKAYEKKFLVLKLKDLSSSKDLKTDITKTDLLNIERKLFRNKSLPPT